MKIINPITVLQDKKKFEEVFKNIEDSYRVLSKTNAFPTENTYNKVMSNTFLQDTFMSFFDKTKNGKSKYENLINEAKEKEFLLNMGCSFKTYIEKVSNDIEFKKGNVSAIYELESLDVGFSKDKELVQESKFLYENVRKELSLSFISQNIRKMTESNSNIVEKKLGYK